MQASKFAKKYVVIRNRSWFNKLRQLFSVTKSVFFSLPKMRQLTPNNFTGQVTQIQPYAFCVKRQSVCNLVFPFSCWSDIFEKMNFFLLIFVILTTTIFAFPISSEFVNENNFFSELGHDHGLNFGRPTKVVIDEIITRSVSLPTKGRSPLSDYRPRPYHAPAADFMLTNRRRDEASDTDETNFQNEGEYFIL